MSATTSALPAATVKGAEVPTEAIFRLTVEQYHEMVRAGILVDGDPVELLEGWLVQKRTKNPPHTVTIGLVQDEVGPLLGKDFHLNVEGPVTTSDSEPEPDVAIRRGKRRKYLKRHPGPQDTPLAIEVPDTSLHRDRTLKKRIYARARIPVYWIVNLSDRQIEVYTDPTGPARKPDYRQRQDYGPDDQVPVVLDGKEVGRIPVRDLLP
jgi:Uma2 family endonuclease